MRFSLATHRRLGRRWPFTCGPVAPYADANIGTDFYSTAPSMSARQGLTSQLIANPGTALLRAMLRIRADEEG